MNEKSPDIKACQTFRCILAIGVLKEREPGAFVIRDSHSFKGAYGLAMKVACPPPSVHPNKKGQERAKLPFVSARPASTATDAVGSQWRCCCRSRRRHHQRAGAALPD